MFLFFNVSGASIYLGIPNSHRDMGSLVLMGNLELLGIFRAHVTSWEIMGVM